MGSVLALLFIGTIAATGIIVATRPTVADGRVIADTIVKRRNITTVECDDRIPIGVNGAVFQCTLEHADGSSERVEYTMDRAGAYTGSLVDSRRARPSDPDEGGAEEPWD